MGRAGESIKAQFSEAAEESAKRTKARLALIIGASPIMAIALGWVPMIALGVLHSKWAVVPLFGYWETVVTLVSLPMVVGFLRPATGKK